MHLPSFNDSTNLLNDGEALSGRLHQDGYLFIRNLISREKILAIRSRLMHTASQAGWLNNMYPSIEGVATKEMNSSLARKDHLKTLSQMWCDEALQRLRTSENIISLFERIFKEPVLAHPRFFMRHLFPDDPATDSHQDHIFTGGSFFCTMWIPLGDCTVEEGPLCIAPKSHLHGVLDSEFCGMGIKEDFSEKWVTDNFDAGDVLIFTNFTVHKSLINTSQKLRLSVDARYQPANLPIIDEEMLPVADSGYVNWESVYANWSSKYEQFFWRKFDIKTIEIERKYFEPHYLRAFDLAKQGNKSIQESLLRLI